MMARLTHRVWLVLCDVADPLLDLWPRLLAEQRNLLVRVPLDPDPFPVCCVVEHVVEEDRLLLDLVELLLRLRTVVRRLVRFLEAQKEGRTSVERVRE